MIWVAWFTLALESLVIAPSLWIMWVLISEASRAPDDPLSPEERPPDCSPARSLEHPQEAKDEGLSLREDEGSPPVRPRGSRRAGLCEQQEAPHGLRGGRLQGSFRGQDRRREKFSQRAAVCLGLWPAFGVAEKALVHAEFNTHPRDGIVGVDEFERGFYPRQQPRATSAGGGTLQRGKWRGF